LKSLKEVVSFSFQLLVFIVKASLTTCTQKGNQGHPANSDSAEK